MKRETAMRIRFLKFLITAAIPAVLFGCLKSGTGIGLTERGEVATQTDPCALNPLSAGCTIDSCKMIPPAQGCPVDSCLLDPARQGCTVDPCLADPTLPSCQPGPDCGTTPKPVECLDQAFFNANIAPIFKENCEECHKPSGQAWTSTKLSLETATGWDSLVNIQSKEMAPDIMMRVRPGLPDSSYLYLKVTKAFPPVGARMPLGKAALTADQLEAIRTWISGKN